MQTSRQVPLRPSFKEDSKTGDIDGGIGVNEMRSGAPNIFYPDRCSPLRFHQSTTNIMYRLLKILSVVLLTSSCSVSKNTSQIIPDGQIAVVINDTIHMNIRGVATMNVDEEMGISELSIPMLHYLNEDNRIVCSAIVKRQTINPIIEPRTYNLWKFTPEFMYLNYDSLINAYRSSEYIPIDGSMEIHESVSINPNLTMISGQFSFIGYNERKNDTVVVTGEFNQIEYDHLFDSILE